MFQSRSSRIFFFVMRALTMERLRCHDLGDIASEPFGGLSLRQLPRSVVDLGSLLVQRARCVSVETCYVSITPLRAYRTYELIEG